MRDSLSYPSSSLDPGYSYNDTDNNNGHTFIPEATVTSVVGNSVLTDSIDTRFGYTVIYVDLAMDTSVARWTDT